MVITWNRYFPQCNRGILLPHPPGFAIEGPSQAKIEYDDQNDGSCDVKYWPKEPGEYAVHIMCDDEDIKDSPYMAFIHPAAGDYNPDLVSQLLLFLSSLSGSGHLPFCLESCLKQSVERWPEEPLRA